MKQIMNSEKKEVNLNYLIICSLPVEKKKVEEQAYNLGSLSTDRLMVISG